MQERRRKRIIERWSGSHDEIVGPVVIIALIFLAVAVNFGLRVGSRLVGFGFARLGFARGY